MWVCAIVGSRAASKHVWGLGTVDTYLSTPTCSPSLYQLQKIMIVMRVFIVSAYISLHIFLSYLPDTLTSFTVFCGVGVMDILGLEDVVVTVV